ncbi:hypothetical protein ATR1_042d0096 [Acetobacter tropicalis]|uniref:Uncharacterized protein n=3 Tax=Acetobacter tropicalis TaxID=104102 RepID=A0A511FM97_9PROT|nr:hypothetical protein ATR1_042d0096 [Acetobacter tropicalis]GEL49687.1 hypothetical protein ATR01nite_07620 [Acetobacter tropicalis]
MVAAPAAVDSAAAGEAFVVVVWGQAVALEAAGLAVAAFAPVVPALAGLGGEALGLEARVLEAPEEEDSTGVVWAGVVAAVAGAAVGAEVLAGVTADGDIPITVGGGVDIQVGAGELAPMAAGDGVGALRSSSVPFLAWL